ncbi:MAG TPA: PDZ domain-containing protein [Tepidisphaeraceae bacterium]|jgi:S1-C subfamily serine protease
MNRFAPLASIALLAACSVALAQTKPATPAGALLEKVRPSLVVVQFTYEGELGRRELSAMGVVVRDDGLTIVPSELTPRQLPDEQIKEFKLIIPGDDETEIEAVMLGRDERYNLTFIVPKTKPATPMTPITFVGDPLSPGQTVRSVGLLPKTSGYTPYVYESRVAAVLRGPVPQVLVDGSGMTVTGSAVFDDSGRAIGLVNAQNDRLLVLGDRTLPLNDRSLILNDPRNPNATVENPTRVFVPASDFLPALESPPTLEQPLKFPFIGVVQLTGLTKDVAEFYGLQGKVAIQVGDVIPSFSAARAGLKKGDVIVSLEGRPLERGDLPEESPMIFTRHLSRLSVGQNVTLGVITKAGTEPKPVEVTLDERPAPASRAKRFYAEDLGFTARDVAFEDTFSRKLAADVKGVIVAFVRPQSGAQSANLDNGDFVRQINQTPVTGIDQFKEQYEAFRKEKPKEAVVLEVLRSGNTQIIRIEPPRE